MDAWDNANVLYLLIGIQAAIIVICFIWIGRLSLKIKEIRNFFNKIYAEQRNDGSLDVLERLLERIERAEAVQSSLKDKLLAVEKTVRKRKGNVGMVRFSPFVNEGSDLSFSIAIIDDDETGFVLTSIYGREESRVYAKPLTRGSSIYNLTDEEKEAIEEAKKVL